MKEVPVFPAFDVDLVVAIDFVLATFWVSGTLKDGGEGFSDRKKEDGDNERSSGAKGVKGPEDFESVS